jgi:hypothetical protein
MSFWNKTENYHQILEEDFGLPLDDEDYWWVRRKKRAVSELRKMEKNTNAVVFDNLDELVWEEEIVNNFGTCFTILITAGPNYPFSMPKVCLEDSEIDVDDVDHLYAGGELCLMHPDRYNSRMSILQFRNMACSWVLCAEIQVETGKWPGASAD